MMNTRVVRLAQGLERIVIGRVAHAQRQREELSQTDQRIAAQSARETERVDALHHLYAGPLRLDRVSLFDLRRRGAVLRKDCAELRAGIALLQEDAARMRAEIEAEVAAVIALRRRQSRLLQWADTDRRARRLKQEQRLEREQEEWVWRMWVS
jgi:hypothetical protein